MENKLNMPEGDLLNAKEEGIKYFTKDIHGIKRQILGYRQSQLEGVFDVKELNDEWNVLRWSSEIWKRDFNTGYSHCILTRAEKKPEPEYQPDNKAFNTELVIGIITPNDTVPNLPLSKMKAPI